MVVNKKTKIMESILLLAFQTQTYTVKMHFLHVHVLSYIFKLQFTVAHHNTVDAFYFFLQKTPCFQYRRIFKTCACVATLMLNILIQTNTCIRQNRCPKKFLEDMENFLIFQASKLKILEKIDLFFSYYRKNGDCFVQITQATNTSMKFYDVLAIELLPLTLENHSVEFFICDHLVVNSGNLSNHVVR